MTRAALESGAVALLAVLLVTLTMSADLATRKTEITLSEPVRVPGTLLPAGTYLFQSPIARSRTIVRITGKDGRLMTQVMGIADFTRKTDQGVITFGGRQCWPQAIKAWFYPGSRSAVRVVYAKHEAEVIAAACNESVPEVHETKPDMAQIQVYRVYLITPQNRELEYEPRALSESDQSEHHGLNAEAVENQPERDSFRRLR